MGQFESFVARWSRRKQLVAARAREAPQPATQTNAPETLPVAAERAEDVAIVEPPPLPPIESLDAGSDITPFLAPGVPAELTRQALRRAWTADPAVRDFVGLSENAWDFTAAGGVPGFGPLSGEDAGRLLARALGAGGSAEPPQSGQVAALPAADTAAPGGGPKPAGDVGTPQDFAESEINRPSPPPSHGGALSK